MAQLVYHDLQPAAEWTEDAQYHVLRVPLPGFKREEFRVQIDNSGKLTVRGRRPLGQGNYVRVDQAFQLPQDSEATKISGKFEEGWLSLVIPKKVIPPPEKKEIMPQKAVSPQEKEKEPPSHRDDKPEDAEKKTPMQKTMPKSAARKEEQKEMPRGAERKEEEHEEKPRGVERKEEEYKEKPKVVERKEEKPLSSQKKEEDSIQKEKPRGVERKEEEYKEKPKVVERKEEKPTLEEKPLSSQKKEEDSIQKEKPRGGQETKAPAQVDQQEPKDVKKKEQHPVIEHDAGREEPNGRMTHEDGPGKPQKRSVRWKERIEEEIEGWLDYGYTNGVLEVINRNKKLITVAVLAFSAGFYVSRKLKSNV